MIASHGEQASALCRRGGTTEDKQVANTDPTEKGMRAGTYWFHPHPRDTCFPLVTIVLSSWMSTSRTSHGGKNLAGIVLFTGRSSSSSFFANGLANGRCVAGHPRFCLLCSTSCCDLPWPFHFLSLRRRCGAAPMIPAHLNRGTTSSEVSRRRTAVSMLRTAW